MIRLSDIAYRFRRASADECKALIERGRHASGWLREVCGYLERYSWWIHDGDLRLPSNVVNDIHLIVTGDLIIDGWYDDNSGEGGMLAVFGSMRCQHVFSNYGMFVGEDLLTQGLNFQEGNDWCFECGGQMAARAFICYDKFSDYDRNREAFEGYWDFNYGLDKNYRDAYEMLGLDLKEDCNWPAIVQHVKTAEAEGRSPFILPEPATTVAWREALHPATTAKRLMELAASHAWDVAMRPQLAPELQDILVRHDDVRVRWAIASAPCASEANLRRLATGAEPAVRAAVAHHANCPEDLWVGFAKDPAPHVRAAVMHAPGKAARKLDPERQ